MQMENERARTDTHHVRTHLVGPQFSDVCIQLFVCAQLTSQRTHISKDTHGYSQKRSGRSPACDRPIAIWTDQSVFHHIDRFRLLPLLQSARSLEVCGA